MSAICEISLEFRVFVFKVRESIPLYFVRAICEISFEFRVFVFRV